MLPQQHNIKNFVLNLELDRSRQEAHTVKDELLELISTEVSAELDHLLSRKVDASTTLKIDKLQINVDPLDWKSWKQEFVRQCREKIKAELDSVVPQAMEKGGQTLHLRQVSPRNAFDSAVPFQFDQVQRTRIRFFHFLQYGHFPWWGKPSHWDEWEEEVLNLLIRKHPTRFFYTLKAFLRRWPNSIDRLYTQYSKDFLQSFLQLCQASKKARELKLFITDKSTSLAELQQALALIFLEEIQALSSWKTTIETAKARLLRSELSDASLKTSSPQDKPSSPIVEEERLEDGEMTKALTDSLSEEETPAVQDQDLDHTPEKEDQDWHQDTAKSATAENLINTQDDEPASGSRQVSDPQEATPTDPSDTIPEEISAEEKEEASWSHPLEKSEAKDSRAKKPGEEQQTPDQKSAAEREGKEATAVGKEEEKVDTEELISDPSTTQGSTTTSTDESAIQASQNQKEEQYLAEAEHFLDATLVNRSSQELDAAFIQNAGLALVIPCLFPVFSALGYLNEKGLFTSKNAQWRAATLLQFMATGETDPAEYELTLNKIACGLRLSEPIERIQNLSQGEKDLGIELLTTLVGHVKKLKNTSVEGMRYNFLLRKGKISFEKNHWLLRVEKASYDPFLLDDLPWSMGMVKFRWMPKRLQVEWL